MLNEPVKVKFLTSGILSMGEGQTVQFNHKQGGPDFSAVQKGQVRLFSNHTYGLESQLGDILEAWHDEQASYAMVQLYDIDDDPLIKKAQYLLARGHKGLSAGIREHSEPRRLQKQDYMVDRWQLGEISVTGIPRDLDTDVNLDASPIFYVMGGNPLLQMNADPEAPIMDNPPTPKPILEIPSPAATFSPSTIEAIESLAPLLSALNGGGTAPPDPMIALSNKIDKLTDEMTTLVKNQTDKEKSEKDEVDKAKADEDAETERVKAEEEAKIKAEEDEAKANATKIDEASKIALSMTDIYNVNQLGAIRLQALEDGATYESFKEKMSSIQIQPTPSFPGISDPGMGEYSILRALGTLASGRQDEGKFEWDISQNIINKSNLGLHPAGTLAIPKESLSQLKGMVNFVPGMGYQLASTANSGGNSTELVSTPPVMLYRSDVPDPLDIIGMLTMLPSGPGDPRLIAVTVPKPAMVAEPGDTGYAKTGDASTADVTLSPHILNDKMILTRLTNVQAPAYLGAVLAIAMARMREVQNEQVMIGSGASNQVTGIYNYTGIGSSAALTNVAGITTTVMDAAIDNCFAFAPESKRIITSPATRAAMRNVAQPTAVARFYMDGMIHNIPLLVTEYFGSTKPARGIVGPMIDAVIKEWDDAIFVSRRLEEGIEFLNVESFWDFKLRHAGQFQRLRQD